MSLAPPLVKRPSHPSTNPGASSSSLYLPGVLWVRSVTGALPAAVMNQHPSALDPGVVSVEPLLPTGDVQLPVGEHETAPTVCLLSVRIKIFPRDPDQHEHARFDVFFYFLISRYFRAEGTLRGKEWSLFASADANHACLLHFQPL